MNKLELNKPSQKKWSPLFFNKNFNKKKGVGTTLNFEVGKCLDSKN